ncbi:Uncharacterised protein [Vibrio cholerae]|nr:Uncharacterised protein [Vibrio cholerae]
MQRIITKPNADQKSSIFGESTRMVRASSGSGRLETM